MSKRLAAVLLSAATAFGAVFAASGAEGTVAHRGVCGSGNWSRNVEVVGQQLVDEFLRGLGVTDRQLASSEHRQVVGGGDTGDRVEASTSRAGHDGAQLDSHRPFRESPLLGDPSFGEGPIDIVAHPLLARHRK